MQITIFYFSGTGNTLWAARQFAAAVEGLGGAARLVAVESAPGKDAALAALIDGSDCVGFAYPIYGANMPPVMKAFVARLAGLPGRAGKPGKPACCIATFGFVNGFGPFCARRLLAGAGFDLRCHVNVRLCNNLSTPRARTAPLPAGALAERKQKAAAQLGAAARDLMEGKRHIEGVGPYLLAGIGIRKVSGPLIARNHQSMGVDMSLCTRCMACVRNCPTRSIEYRDEGGFAFLPSCTACARCYNNCPAAAVTIGGSHANPQVYRRYRGPE